jgi:hypothetical protein
MFKLTGIIVGIGLSAFALYSLAPSQMAEIQTQITETSLDTAAAILNKVDPPLTMVLDAVEQVNAATNDLQVSGLPLSENTLSTEPNLATEVSELQDVVLENLALEDDANLQYPSSQTVLFWRAFDNKEQAQAFTSFLEKRTGFTYEVLVENNGHTNSYQAALTVPDGSDITEMLAIIENITGPAPTQHHTG